MLFRGIGALHLLSHVVDLEREDGEAVDGPRRTLGIDTCIGQRDNVAILVAQIAVYLLHEVGAVLVAAVDASLDEQSLHGIDVRVADDILKMPLHGVDPAFQIKACLYAPFIIRVADGCVNIVCQVIICYRPAENLIAKLGK